MSYMIARTLIIIAGVGATLTAFTLWQQDIGGDKREWEIVTRSNTEAKKRDDKVDKIRKRNTVDTAIDRLWREYDAATH